MRKADLPALTGIRFYAALAVYFSHVSILPGMGALSASTLFFGVGVVGVSFFFALSGFILTYNYQELFDRGLSALDYRTFVWARFTKIYPVHFAMVVFTIPLQVLSPNMPLDWKAVPFHLLLAQCFWPFPSSPYFSYLNVPSWSISCEWFFYLLAPLLIVMSGRVAGRWLITILIGTYAASLVFLLRDQSEYTQLYLVSWFAPSRIVEFTAGIFLARVFSSPQGKRTGWISGLTQIGGIVFIVAGANYRAYAPWPFHGGLLYLPGSLLLIYGLACGRGPLVRHLSRRTLTLLGAASFSFYLIHAPILRVLKGICLKLGWEIHTWISFWIVAIAVLVTIQGAALIIFKYYETPLLKRLRQFFYPVQVRGRRTATPIEPAAGLAVVKTKTL